MNRPFNSATYARLLEGLEATEIRFADVLYNNSKIRIDAAYFSKDALRVQALIEALPCGFTRLGDTAATFRKGIFDIKAESYTEIGVPFVRIGDLKPGLTDDTAIAYISEESHAQEQKTALSFGDIVLSKTAYPAAAFVTFERCNVSQDTIAYKLASTWRTALRTGFIVAFLNSSHGKTLLWRQFQGNVQLHLSLSDAATIPIPLLSYAFQTQIESALLTAHQALQKSQGIYADAERLLLTELGLLDWQPPQPQSYERRASAAFAAGRLDAEYFSPRVAELLARLERDSLTVGEVAPPRFDPFVRSESPHALFDYIEIGDLKQDGTADSQRLYHRDAPSRATWHVQAGDVITSTVRPIRRLSALIQESQAGFVCSSGFLVLNPTHVSTELLLVYLRLPLVCELMDLHTTASMYPAISAADLLALPFPAIASDVEQQIVEAVQAAHRTKVEAHTLLARATRAVEIAIEESEAAALAFLAPA